MIFGNSRLSAWWDCRHWRDPSESPPGYWLTYNADGPYWDNSILVPAYATGWSYFRPFRYLDSWIQDELLDIVKEQPKSLEGLQVTLGMRFLSSEHRDRVVPVRKAVITHVSPDADLNLFYFRLGRFHTVPSEATIDSLALSTAGHDGASQPHLFFRAESLTIDRALVSVKREMEAWTRLVDHLGRDDLLPTSAAPRRAVYFHAMPPREKDYAQLSAISRSWEQGWRFGPRLPEGKSFELPLHHRIPANLADQVAVEPFQVNIAVSTTDLATSPAAETISGNYDNHVLTLSPHTAKSPWTDVAVQAPERIVDQHGGLLTALPLHLPVRVVWGPWYRISRRVVPIVAVAIALFLSSFAAAQDKFKHDPGAALASAGASFLASFLLFLFKR